jgi:exo-beta-1,3-glucanase (GH17 family)
MLNFARLAAPMLLSVLAAVLAVGWWLDGRPVALPDAPTARLECVSYSPSGATDGMPRNVRPERIRADLESLSREFDCVRTYSVVQGLDQVPAIARELGLEVLLGVWIGREAKLNEIEVERAIEIARTERDVLRGIVVGNEVLLRHEQTPDQLAALIHRVRAATDLPVTYADVWGFWVKHRAVSSAVSFVTVHIIPYWDDDPVGIDGVIPYVDRLYREMQATFPGKRVFIGETGWPSVGRPRGPNVPGRVNQARYIREFTALAHERGIPYNLIEAFDQPWKRGPEGTVGGYWGLQDVHGQPKFPLVGPMTNVPGAMAVFWAALAGAGVGAAIGAWRYDRRRLRAAVLLGAVGSLVASIGARQYWYTTLGNLNVVDWVATLGVAVAGWIALALALREALDDRNGTEAPPGGMRVLREPWAISRIPTRLELTSLLRLLLLLCAAYVSLGLAFAGRHRDFPVWLFLPGVLGLVIASIRRAREYGAALRRDRAIEEALLACWLVVAAVWIPAIERFCNLASAAWGLAMLAAALAVLVPVGLQPPGEQQPAQHPDS